MITHLLSNVRYVRTLLLWSLIFITKLSLSQTVTQIPAIPECDSIVPTFQIDLSGSPIDSAVTDDIIRQGLCCSSTSPDKYLAFYVTLHPDVAMIEVGIAEGADPSGSGEYYVVSGGDLINPGACGTATPGGQSTCITGPGPHKIAYNKPGGNAVKFYVKQIPKPIFPQNDTTRVDCYLPLNVYGLTDISITSINSSTGVTTSGFYNDLLSCTNCSNPVFNPGAGTPEWIDYVITGTQQAATICGTYVSTDTVRLYTMDLLDVSYTPSLAEFCSGGSVDMTATATGGDGNYTYEWFTSGGTLVSSTNTYSAITQDIYQLEVNDGLSSSTCPAAIIPVNVIEGVPPTANAGVDQTVCATSPNAFLAGSVTDATGGIWSGGNGTFNPNGSSLLTVYTPTNTEIAAGSVTLTLTSTGAGGGCPEASDDITIFFSDTVFVSPSFDPVTCNGDTTNVYANVSGGSPGYSYSWSTGSNSSTINEPSGTYSVTVSDIYGCSVTGSITVVEPPSLFLIMTSTNTSTDLACDGTATVSISGGVAPYTVLWDNTQTTLTATGLCYGISTVTVTDANGCQIQGSVVVNNPTCSAFDVTATNTDVDCYGDSDAQAFSFPTGGTLPYSYEWNTFPIQSTQNATGLSAGTHTVTVTDANGCIDLASVTVQQPTVITNTMTHVDVTTIGGNNGSATANPLGGTPGYTYSWVPTSQTTQTAMNLFAGTYYVSIQDGNSCLKSDSVQINEPPCNDFMLGVNTTDISCFGLTDGTANVVIAQGTAPYSITWSSGQTDVTSVSGLSAGTYTVTVTDASNCTTFETFDIVEPNQLTIGIVPTNVSCYGAGDGTIDVTVSGGVYPYTYTWTYGAATIANYEDLENLIPGTYSIKVKDANGCRVSGSRGITQPNPIAATFESHDILCNGSVDGAIDATVSGGILPYSYSWTGPNGFTSSSQDITGLEYGLYNLTISDGNGCLKNDIVQGFINEPEVVQIESYTIPCPVPGANEVLVTVDSVSGGSWGVYDISFDGGTTFQPTGDYDALLALDASYDIEARDSNGCVVALPITINIDPKVEILAVDFDPCISVGTTDINITVSPAGGDGGPYEVSTDGGVSFNPVGVYTMSVPVGNSYSVVIRDGKGCNSLPFDILIPSAFDANATLTAEVSCGGASDGAIDLTVSGGTSPYTYSWSGPSGFTSSLEDISGLVAGTYNVSVLDDSSCVTSTSITVTTTPDVTPPTILTCGAGDQSEFTDPNGCYFTNIGTAWDATASDNCVVSSITYNLTGATTGSGVSLDGVQFNIGVTTVTWTVLDGSGNSATCSFNVTVADNELPVISSCGATGTQTVNTDSGVCTYTLSGTGWDAIATDNCTVSSVSYVLTGATTGSGSTLDGVVFNQGTTTVTWIVTDAAGNYSDCTFDVAVIDVEQPVISSCGATGTQTVSSNSGVCNYTHSGTGWNAIANDNCTVSSVIYTLSGATIGSGTSLDGAVFNLGTTTVTWTVTDAAGNNSTCTFDVNVVDTELPQISSCGPSGNQTVNANLGTCTYTYSGTGWNAQATDNCSVSSIVYTLTGATTGSGTSLNGVSFNLGTTLVTWTVTDGSGNTSTCSFSVTVEDDQDPVILSCGAAGTQNVSTDLGTCSYTQMGTGWDATATDNCSIGSLQYSLFGATTGSGSSLDGVTFAQGTTLVTWTVTDGSGNTASCSFSVIVSDNETPIISNCPSNISVSNDNANCGAVVTWTPPTYTDNCGATMTSTHNPGDFFPVGTTTVTYTVTDGNNNVSSCVFDVTVNDAELPQITCQTDYESCDSLVNFSTPNATDNCGVVSVTQIAGMPSGSVFPVGTTVVTFEALDVHGNTSTCSFNVIINPTPELSVSTTDVSCNSAGDGAIDLTVTNGSVPYSYSWSNGASTEDLTSLQPGSYSVQVTDLNGCSASISALITEPDQLTLNKEVQHVSCFGGDNGEIDITVAGGTLPYLYSWSNGEVGEDIDSLLIGTYVVTVTDANGCQIENTTTITQPTEINILTTSYDATCDAPNGSIQTLITGGVTPYSYLWDTGATTANLNNVIGGNYTLTVTDANGCISAVQDSVNSTSNISIVVYPSDVLCNGDDNGSAIVAIESGNAPFTYDWSTGNTGNQVTGLFAGNYDVTVTDNFGCQQTVNFDIFEPDPLTLELFSPENLPGYNISIYGGSDGSIESTVDGGTDPYFYLWSNGATTPGIYGLTSGIYYLTVTDDNGCTLTNSIRITEPDVLEMPEGVSPNGDYDNDFFVVKGLESYPENDITIYNRWGNIVYQESGYENDWYGQNNKDELLPDGTYFVILNAHTEEETKTLTGYIDLRRSK